MTPQDRPVSINISGISVSGVGGLGLVAMAAVVAWFLPRVWWVEVVGVAGGTLLAIAIIAYRRNHVSSAPSGDDPSILFRAEEPTPNRARAHDVPPADIAELATL